MTAYGPDHLGSVINNRGPYYIKGHVTPLERVSGSTGRGLVGRQGKARSTSSASAEIRAGPSQGEAEK